MKNAPDKYYIESALIQRHYIAGLFPERCDTVSADVLAQFLKGRELTGIKSVFSQSTTRLPAVVHYLTQKYGWRIERREIATGTNDGRVAWISVYWMSPSTIAEAYCAGAAGWVREVEFARAQRRREARQCRLMAAQRNKARGACLHDPRQGKLWEDGDV